MVAEETAGEGRVLWDIKKYVFIEFLEFAFVEDMSDICCVKIHGDS